LYECNPKEHSAQNDKVKSMDQRRPVRINRDQSWQGDKFEVIEDGQVAITDGWEHDGKEYYLLSARERFDLKARAKL